MPPQASLRIQETFKHAAESNACLEEAVLDLGRVGVGRCLIDVHGPVRFTVPERLVARPVPARSLPMRASTRGLSLVEGTGLRARGHFCNQVPREHSLR